MTSRLLFLTVWKTDTAAQILLLGSEKPEHAEGHITHSSDSTLFL